MRRAFPPQDGGFHPVDSSAIAFEIAARAAFKEGAGKAKPIVMEPIMKAPWIPMAPWHLNGLYRDDLGMVTGTSWMIGYHYSVYIYIDMCVCGWW